MPSNWRTCLCFIIVGHIQLFGVLAEFTHFTQHNMIDSRAGGMGGTYIALSDTLSGSYYNPAGLAFIDHFRMTESSNMHRSTTLTYTGIEDNFSYEFHSTTTVPPFIGLFQQFDPFNMAFSVIVPKSEKYNKKYKKSFTDANGSAITFYENFDGHNDHYLIGPSIATLITQDISLGIGVFYSHETRNYIQNIFTFPTNYPTKTQIWSNTYNEEITEEIMVKLGLQWMPNTRWSFGTSLTLPIQLSSKGYEQKTMALIDSTRNEPASTSSLVHNLSTMGFKSNYPSLGIGIAHLFSTRTLATMDIRYMMASSDAPIFPATSVANISMGVEHYVSPMFPFRAGIYTNSSYFPKHRDGDHLNGMGITASLGYESGGNSLSIGIDFQHGKGSSTSNGITTLGIDFSSATVMVSGQRNI